VYFHDPKETLDEFVFVNPSDIMLKQLSSGGMGFLRPDINMAAHYATTELREQEAKSLETLRAAEAVIQSKTEILRKRLYAAEAEIAKLRGSSTTTATALQPALQSNTTNNTVSSSASGVLQPSLYSSFNATGGAGTGGQTYAAYGVNGTGTTAIAGVSGTSVSGGSVATTTAVGGFVNSFPQASLGAGSTSTTNANTNGSLMLNQQLGSLNTLGTFNTLANANYAAAYAAYGGQATYVANPSATYSALTGSSGGVNS